MFDGVVSTIYRNIVDDIGPMISVPFFSKSVRGKPVPTPLRPVAPKGGQVSLQGR
jgi:hypothetical protein